MVKYRLKTAAFCLAAAAVVIWIAAIICNAAGISVAKHVKACEDVTVELTETDGQMYLTVTNLGTRTLTHGSVNSAQLQIRKLGIWYYDASLQSGWDDILYTLEAGQTFTDAMNMDAYGALPDGTYRFVLGINGDDAERTYAVTRFTIKNGALAA